MHLPPHELLNVDRPFWTRLILPLAIGTAALLLPLVFTQSIAHQLAFHSALGPRWLHPLPGWLVFANIALLGITAAYLYHHFESLLPCVVVVPPTALSFYLGFAPIYPPLAGFQWYLSLIHGLAGWEVILRAALTAVVTAVCLVGAGIITNNLLRRRYHPSRVAHGSAHYAKLPDLRRRGMVGLGGVFLGTFGKGRRPYYLSDDSQHHTLFVMPPGAGKSAGHIIPSLLTRTHSAFVLDPKGELYAATAGWRAAQGHRCIRLAPLEDPARTDCWNPLMEIKKGGDDVGALGLLADALITASAHEDSHWNDAARSLFRCLALHALYTGDPPGIHEVRTMVHHSEGLTAVLKGILGSNHDQGAGYGWRDPEKRRLTLAHPEATLLARGFLKTPEKEMGSIASTLRRALALWGDRRMIASTTYSDFDLGIFNQKDPVTLYCVVPYSDLHHLSPWVRMLLASLVRTITHHREAEAAAPLDLYLDEFASLGRVKIIHEILSFLRGYGVRAHIVIQAYEDLQRLYGAAENISACQIHVAAATLSRASRQFISDLGGEATIQWERRSNSGAPVQPMPIRQNRTPTETRRPLITQGEVATLNPDEILIAKTGMSMIRARKHFYFDDRELSRRAGMPLPERPERIRAESDEEADGFDERLFQMEEGEGFNQVGGGDEPEGGREREAEATGERRPPRELELEER
jgi:type IV secretion system protein VirD4